MHESCTRYAVIPCISATTPPAGRCRCWGITSRAGTAVRSRLARCGGGCGTWACDGNGPGTSMRPRIRTVPRKKGACSPPETHACSGGVAVFGCDDPTLVSAAAICVGVSWRAGQSQDHRPECQTGLVRHDQSSDRTPSGPASAAATTGGLPSLPAVSAATLSGPADLVVAGQGFLSPGRRKPAVGRPIGSDPPVAAQAVPGIEFPGPPMERVEAFDRRESPIPND